MDKKIKIGFLGIRGLPARYGAFEETSFRLASYLSLNSMYQIYVGCSNDLKLLDPLTPKKINRVFAKRRDGFGTIIYGLSLFAKMYKAGVRNFLFFGYALAPFFKLFDLLGCKITCNVDGFEWRREKWSAHARYYFKFCEWLIGNSSHNLIFDSEVIERYYKIKYKKLGKVIFYGSDVYVNTKDNYFFSDHKDDFACVVMRLEPENNILTIIEAFLESKTNINLLVIGPETKYFKECVLPLISASNKKIQYYGPEYNRETLFAIRSKASFYIHGHSVGGTNPTLIEACIIGKPIVAYKSSFNKEVLKDKAVFFKSSRDLARILNDGVQSYPLPPILDKRYTWDYVVREYEKRLS
jgi:hypothetical protein